MYIDYFYQLLKTEIQMEPVTFYNKRIEILRQQLKRLEKKKSAFGWLRFGSIVAIIIAFYVLWSLSIWYVILAGVLLLALFIRLLYADLNNKAAIAHVNFLLEINHDELKILDGNYHDFFDGAQYAPEHHLYANDLDIFGRASLFQYINRSTSEMGSWQLANYLQFPADINLIFQRQMAVKELSGKMEWLQDLQAMGRDKQITLSTKKRLTNWVVEPPVFSQFKHWKWLRYLLPAIIISVVVLYIFDAIPSLVFYLSLLVFAAIAYQVNKYVAPIHDRLSKIAEEIETLSTSIAHIENTHFECDLLRDLQSAFFHQEQKCIQRY